MPWACLIHYCDSAPLKFLAFERFLERASTWKISSISNEDFKWTWFVVNVIYRVHWKIYNFSTCNILPISYYCMIVSTQQDGLNELVRVNGEIIPRYRSCILIDVWLFVFSPFVLCIITVMLHYGEFCRDFYRALTIIFNIIEKIQSGWISTSIQPNPVQSDPYFKIWCTPLVGTVQFYQLKSLVYLSNFSASLRIMPELDTVCSFKMF